MTKSSPKKVYALLLALFSFNFVHAQRNCVPAQPGIIIGNENVCQPKTEVYSISDANDTTRYFWYLDNVIIRGSQNRKTITRNWSSTDVGSHQIHVIASNRCGRSLPSPTKTVVVKNASAKVSVINGPTQLFASTYPFTQTYSVPVVAGASYMWDIVGGDAQFKKMDNETIEVTFNAQGTFTLSVIAKNECGIACGTDNITSIQITVGPPPVPQIAPCNGTWTPSQSACVNNILGATYIWEYPQGTYSSTWIVNPAYTTSCGPIGSFYTLLTYRVTAIVNGVTTNQFIFKQGLPYPPDPSCNPTPAARQASTSEFTIDPFKVYPNPTSGNFTIETDGNQGSIVIYNSLGQVVDTVTLVEGTSTYNVTISSTGVYKVNISTTQSNKSMSIVVE